MHLAAPNNPKTDMCRPKAGPKRSGRDCAEPAMMDFLLSLSSIELFPALKKKRAWINDGGGEERLSRGHRSLQGLCNSELMCCLPHLDKSDPGCSMDSPKIERRSLHGGEKRRMGD